MPVRSTTLAQIELRSAIVQNPLVASPEATLMDAIAQMNGESCRVSIEESFCSATSTAAHLFLEARSSCVVVLEHKRVIGILTERDVVRLIAQPQPLNCLTMRQVMTYPVLTARASALTDTYFAVNLLHQYGTRYLIILDEQDSLLGFVTHETLHHMARLEIVEQMSSIAELAIKYQQSEDDLKEREIRWQFALEGAGDGLWDWNVETNQVFLSHQWKAMLGYADDEVGNTIKEWDDRVHPDDKPHCYKELQKHFRGDIPIYQAEHRVRCKDGSYKWVLARGKVIEWAEEGNPLRIIGIHTDVSDRKYAEEQLQNLIEGTAATTGEDFFPALVQYIAKVLNVPYAVVTERVDCQLHTLAFCANNMLQPNFSFPFVNTPCEKVIQDGMYHCEGLAQAEFPDNSILVEMGAQSYLGIALRDNQGQVIGNLCILDKHSIQDPKRAEQILRVFAARATAELERERAIKALEQLNQALENKVKTRTAALEMSEKRYRALMDGASDAILLADVQGNLIEVNQRAEVLFGYSREELTRLHFSQIHSPEAFVMGQEHFRNTGLHNLCPTFESTILRKNLSLAPVEITASCIVLDGEKVIQGIFRDISDRKQAEAALRKSERRYASLIQSVNGIVWEYDFHTNQFMFVSNKAEELLGYPIEVWLSEPNFWKHHIYAEDVFEAEQCFDAAIQEQKSCEMEYRMVAADGTLVWMYDISSPHLDENGQATTSIGVLIDIRDRKVVQEKLQQTNEKLARATRLKDEFLANMSHELRTPLNAILGMTEGLQDKVFGEINERQDKALQTLGRSAFHLLELINDILDVAKIESGQIELDCVPTAISPLLNSSLAFIKQQAFKKRIQIETKLALNLPDLMVDERRIRQVLINLLNNAVKFTPEGGSITLEVSCEQYPLSGLDSICTPSEKFLCISVIDTGIGIAPEHIKRLFQPFIQIHSALNRSYTGTGLGLSLVKRIVELHGGQVRLSSEVGIGSCFSITLPYTATPSFSIPSNTYSGCIETGCLEQGVVPLILLAEDNESNIVTISSYLGAKGYHLVFAKNGREAIAMAQTEKPDLILMDIQMPEMDGLEAMQQIRRNPTLVDVPIIALTALAMEGDREKCLAAGANDYLSKPIKLKQLATTIQKFLFAE